MGIPQGSRILVSGYTCMVVPSAIQYAGLVPAYVDIDPETYNLNPALLESIPPPAPEALIVQHTYGIPCNMTALGAWAKSKNVPVIEDNCHAFGSRWDGKLCGTFGVFSFLSGQWNKPFPTGLGGILLVNDPRLADAVEQLVQSELKKTGWWTNVVLRGQIAAYDLLVRPSTTMLLTLVYRVMSRLGLARGSSSRVELQGKAPEDYFSAMAPCQARRGEREMARIADNIRHRTELTAFYHSELPRLGFAPLRVPGVEHMPLLRYPVRVTNKDQVLSRTIRNRVEIGSWFECPLHPASTHMEDFGYRRGMCPESERAAREVVNLPTHRKVSLAAAERTLHFLKQYAHPVE